MFEIVGSVEILRLRNYPIDPLNKSGSLTEVLVQPGVYPLYSDGLSYFWLMRGRINTGGFNRVDNGMFTMKPYDDVDESMPEVDFPSPTFGLDEFDNLLKDESFTSRVRVDLHTDHRNTDREDTDPEHATELN